MIPGFDPRKHYFTPLEKSQTASNLQGAQLEENSLVIDLTPKGEKKEGGLALRTVTLMQRDFQRGTLIVNLDCTADRIAREIVRGYSNKLGWCGWLRGRARELLGKESTALTDLRKITEIVEDLEQLCRAQSRAGRGLTGIRKTLYQLSEEQNMQKGGIVNMTPLQAARICTERLKPSLALFKMEDVAKESNVARDTALSAAIQYLSTRKSPDAAPRHLGEAVELLGYSFFDKEIERTIIHGMERLLGIQRSPPDPTTPTAGGKGKVPTKGRPGAHLAYGATVVQAPPLQNPFTAYHLGALSNRAIVLAKQGFFNAALSMALLAEGEPKQKAGLFTAIKIGWIVQAALDRCEATGSFNEQGRVDMDIALGEMKCLQHPEFVEIAIGYMYQLFGVEVHLFDNLLNAMMAKDGKDVALKAIKVWPNLSETDRDAYRKCIDPS